MDEDFTKFFKEFKNCLLANRIRAEDQVAKLREHLKGSTKTLIPATLKTVDEAFNILNPIYGHASRVMKSRKAKISALQKLNCMKEPFAFPCYKKCLISW